MNLRLTPLNIVSSILLVGIAYLVVYADSSGWRLLGAIPMAGLAIISFIADIIFRRALIRLKRIWIVESLFLIFAAILILIIQKF